MKRPAADRLLNVSCVYGQAFRHLYPAPRMGHSVFFSNNPDLAREARRKGWQFMLDRERPLSSDATLSSCQSKYVKFLGFLEDYPDLRGYPEILYFDHKFEVQDPHIASLRALADPGRAMLLRYAPVLKESVDEEIEASLAQARYADSMAQTRAWIEERITEGTCSRRTRIMNTGLLYYSDAQAVAPLLQEMRQAVEDLRQPQCQILFAMLHQPYRDRIQMIDWEAVPIKWEAPRNPWKARFRALKNRLRGRKASP